MKFSVKWLRDYVKTTLSPREIAETLTNVGLEVEDVEEVPGDAMLDAEVTTNRPDWLCLLGIARELSAATGVAFARPEPKLDETGEPVDDPAAVEVLDTELCPRYTARVITDVRVGPSPPWLVEKVESMGLRTVNNVVDITNFVLFECGQPLHAFDYDTLDGGRIIVRRAVKGETITAIDGSRHELDGTELMICDAVRPVAIGGVMGGLDTEVSSATTTVLLESARFKPVNIRLTSHRLALESDSSYRFARGIDPAGVKWASDRAAALIAELCGGKVCPGIIDVDADPYEPRELTLRMGRIPRILGIEIDRNECRGILERLGCRTVSADGEQLVVRVPSWRGDLEREIDLVEEVARCHGYHEIPASADVRMRMGRRDEHLTRTELAAHVLTAAGFDECVTFSFTNAGLARLVNPWTDAQPLEVRNPIDQAHPGLRTSLVASLLATRKLNQDRRNRDVRLYEIAHVYLPVGADKLPDERLMLGLVADVDFRTLKGVVETVLDRFGLAGEVKTEERTFGFLSDGLALTLGGAMLGYVGQVADGVRERFDLKTRVTAAEIDFGRVMAEAKPHRPFEELPRFPEITRDLAVVVDESVRWGDLRRVIGVHEVPHLESVGFASEFRGRQLGEGKKCLAFSMVFRAPDRTLTGDEADAAQQRVLEALSKELGAALRT
ncbi:MAG TPA: phenylalanine--tRNA ligase subunit beta [Planctomycetota bacterium]|nr:phenylalanine--tRNA ligase subunit beta [Planctomycetota bacterium]